MNAYLREPFAEPSPLLVPVVGVVPLADRRGVVRSVATVDPEDVERVTTHRWFSSALGPVRWTGRGTERERLDKFVLGMPSLPRRHVLHINGDPLDCRKANLVARGHVPTRPHPTDPTALQFPMVSRSHRIVAWVSIDRSDVPLVTASRWHLHNQGYVGSVAADGTLLHRFLMRPGPGLEVDHINRDRLDNRRSNLRVVTRAENNENQPAHRRRNRTSALRGVTRMPSGKWRASLTRGGRFRSLGLYNTEAEAARAASEVRAKHMPFSEDARASAREGVD